MPDLCFFVFMWFSQSALFGRYFFWRPPLECARLVAALGRGTCHSAYAAGSTATSRLRKAVTSHRTPYGDSSADSRRLAGDWQAISADSNFCFFVLAGRAMDSKGSNCVNSCRL